MPKVLKVQRVVNPFVPRTVAARNPRPKPAAAGAKQNPALLVTLGAINPKRRHTVKAKKKNPSTKRRASNPTRVIITAPKKKANSQSAPRIASAKNPVIFGQNMKPVQLGKALAGSLIGVMICKLVPPMLPEQIVGNQALRVLVTGAIAFGSGMAAQKADPVFGDGVMYGGLMQTVSIGLNTYLPSVGSRIALSGTRRPGMGYVVPGQFGYPENPLRNALAAPTPAPVVAMSGVRGFKPAFR